MKILLIFLIVSSCSYPSFWESKRICKNGNCHFEFKKERKFYNKYF